VELNIVDSQGKVNKTDRDMKIHVGSMILVAVTLLGCGTTEETRHELMELGWVNRGAIEKPEYHQFSTTYDTVRVSEEIVDLIRQVESGVDFTVFFGTWCEDSQRELPRFLKVADMVGISRDRIKLYGVDRSKKSSDGLTEKFDIEYVPTIIFLKNGAEIGRIIEKPHATIEEDMVSILAEAQSK
jgi:thiol-disulfide isomerase/thioredoxin